MGVAPLWLMAVARGQSPVALPSAEWVWAAQEPASTHAVLKRTFTAKTGIQNAVIIGACDGRMTVSINGGRIGDITGRERGTSFDVSRHLRAGNNEISLDAAADTGGAVAVIVEIVYDTAKYEWIVTDGSWLGSGGATVDWKPVKRLGRVDAKAGENPFDPSRAVDAYNSWTLAQGVNRATDPADIHVPPGFTVELLRSAHPGEDSWVAMAFDPKGRLTVAREEQPGLLRLTLGASAVEKVEVINATLLECRGLLYAHDALYAHANNSKALYRLRDTDGDDQFDEVRELVRTGGGVGHGRNHLRLGPDGMIYLVVGDDIALPASPAPHSPFKGFTHAPWIPGPRDAPAFAGDRVLSGYIARTDHEGMSWEILAGGLRNPLDVAFNEDGEMFTYDADNERDIGNPWYKPSRVHHVVSGGEYGWRRGLSVLPSYCPDVLPTMHEVGLGSPTGVEFGTRSRFPGKYRQALFIADWAYGRILALHLTPQGASYVATREEFATGRPLNVTDMTIGPDGALYFTTGGRGTQSGLYRIRTTESGGIPSALPSGQADQGARDLRHQLEGFHGRDNSANGREIIATLWPHLGHGDRWVRFAARVALETIELSQWRDKALGETEPTRALTALLALARLGVESEHSAVLSRLNALPLAELSERQQLDALRVYELVLPPSGGSDSATGKAAAGTLDALYPAGSRWVNRELCKLLVGLRAPSVITKTSSLLAGVENQEDIVHFLFFLRHAEGPWTLEQRDGFFTALRKAETGQGAQHFQQVVRDIKNAAAASLTTAERTALAPLLEDKSILLAALAAHTAPPRFVRDWQFEKLDPMLARAGKGRSFARGRAAFAVAQCVLCHRVGTGADAGGLTGPDLTAVASRFNRRDLLDAIVNPSKAMDEKFRSTVFQLRSGGSIAGSIESEDADRVIVRPSPLTLETLPLSVKDIVSRKPLDISPMPAGLLNLLEGEQILDLIAFLESGGNPDYGAFKVATEK